MSLLDKIKSNSTIKDTAILSKSKVYTQKDMVPTPVPMINVALSADPEGGLTPGLTVFAGPSKHFKTMFAFLMGAAYLKKYEDSVILFYDSEFGTPSKYFETLGIDQDRVVHTPITDIEQLKTDLMNQLKNIDRKDKVCIIIDSIGNLASKKEIDDAEDGKQVVDMTRTKSLKSLFRMITPHLTLKDIPLLAINHTYQTLEMYSKAVVSGGTGIYYSANTIWIIGRQQEKDGTDLTGYNFVINIEKSRFVKEKSKIPITVNFSSGIDRWSGLLDNAMESKFVSKNPSGRSFVYQRMDPETGEMLGEAYKLAAIPDKFWEDLLKEKGFKEYLKAKYTIGTSANIEQEPLDDEEDEE